MKLINWMRQCGLNDTFDSVAIGAFAHHSIFARINLSRDFMPSIDPSAGIMRRHLMPCIAITLNFERNFFCWRHKFNELPIVRQECSIFTHANTHFQHMIIIIIIMEFEMAACSCAHFQWYPGAERLIVRRNTRINPRVKCFTEFRMTKWINWRGECVVCTCATSTRRSGWPMPFPYNNNNNKSLRTQNQRRNYNTIQSNHKQYGKRCEIYLFAIFAR